MKPLDAGDPRLAGGYPATFEIYPDYPYAAISTGGDFTVNVKKKKGKKRGHLVDCVVNDLGYMTRPDAREKMGSAQCLRDGVFQNACYENFWTATAAEVEDSKPCIAFGNDHYDKCMALGVTYHYQDEYHFKALVTKGKHKLQHKNKHK